MNPTVVPSTSAMQVEAPVLDVSVSLADGRSESGELEVEGDASQEPDAAHKPKRERKRQQLSCADCHRRKQKCDRNIPCGKCIERGVGHLCHVAEKGTNKSKPKLDSDGNAVPARKRRKRAEIEADAARDLIIARARSVISKAASGDTAAFGQLQRLGDADLDPSAESATYAGPASIQNLIAASGANEGYPLHGPSLVEPSLAINVPELFAQLPPKSLCDVLVPPYLSHSAATYTIQYAPIAVERYYAHAWPVGGERPAVPTSFLCLLAMICAISIQQLAPELVLVVAQYGDPLELRRHFYSLARNALLKSELEEMPDLCRVEAISMMGTYLKNEGRPDDQYILHATAVRSAQALGLHRHAPAHWGLSQQEQELRKRVWWAIYAYDRYSSFHLGRPPVIHDLHCDVELPANLSNKDYISGNFAGVKPLQEYTDSSFLIYECILAGIIGRIFDRAFSTHSPDYSTVLELDAELQTMEESLPPALRAPTTDDRIRHPHIESISRRVIAILCKIRAMLHRPYLLKPYTEAGASEDKYAKSRQLATDLSRRMLACMSAEIQEVPNHLKNNFLFSHLTWEAGCQLAIALQALPVVAKNHDEARMLDKQVLQAKYILEDLAPFNRTARNAVPMLDYMRRRYAATWRLADVPTSHLPGAVNGVSPSNGSTTPSPAPAPSVALDDPLALLSNVAPPISAPPEGQPGPLQDDFTMIGGVFDSGVDWQRTLDTLLSQVGELV